MTRQDLQQFSGSAVDIRIDGAEALGILFFAETGEAYVTSLCYLQPGLECPVIQHVLSDEELQSLSRKSHNQLLSRINLSTRSNSSSLEEETELRHRDDELLMDRLRRVNAKSRALMAQSEELQHTATCNLARMRDLTVPGEGAAGKARTARQVQGEKSGVRNER